MKATIVNKKTQDPPRGHPDVMYLDSVLYFSKKERWMDRGASWETIRLTSIIQVFYKFGEPALKGA